MKKHLLALHAGFLFVFFVSAFAPAAYAQTTDTTVFDYDSYTSCKACGDNIAYNVNGTRDSFTDATPSSFFLSSIKVKIKLFTCYTGILNLTLNGNIVGTASSPYNCACNACDSLIFDISATNIKNYYKYGQKNVFRLVAPGTGLYIDRTIIYRTKSKKSNYDAGILSVDSPSVYVCAGTYNIKIKIYNGGKKQFTGVNVDWKWNGTSQTAATHSGTLDTINGSGSNSAVVTLGSKTFTKGKKDTLMAWTKNPGGITDSTNYNDTVRYIFNGSYGDTLRIGGSSPHFSTIQGAINALMSNGICAPVYVKLWPGTYNEQITIGTIPGSSAANTVTFLSKNNDSSTTVIKFTGTSSLNFTVGLRNTKYIIFNKITIEALSSSYGTVVSMRDNIENISFNNCVLIGKTTTSSGTEMAVVYRNYSSSADKTTNLIFNQTRVNNGAYGLYLANSYSSYLNGLIIKNCIFKDQYYTNLHCSNASNIGIRGNLFERNSSGVYYGYGLRLNSIDDSLSILENRIIQYNAGYGIYLSDAYGSSTKRNLIANNFVSCQSVASYGGYDAIYLDYCTYTDLVFNNVYRKCAENYYCLQVNQGSNNKILYNNFYNKNVGKVFNIVSGSNNNITKSDRNNFYNDGKSLGTWYGSGITTISDLKVLGTDTNSVSANPNYVSSSDLHAYGVDLEGNAKPYTGLEKDIDGQTRNTTKPDIGANEFDLVSLDAGIQEVRQTLPGTRCLKVVLRNFGTTTITSAKIDWKLNGVSKTQVSWSGSLAKGDTDIVCLGNITFLKDSLYMLKAWSSAPNSGTDLLKSNDTLWANFYTAMNGEYSVGGTSPDFASFTAAVAAVEQNGIIDSVLFKVRNGTYTEQIEINSILGANHKNSIIFQSESKDSTKVILQYDAASYDYNYVVWLNGCNGITFRKMTLKNITSSYSRVVYINNETRNPMFENNIFQNFDSTSSNDYRCLVYFDYNMGDNISFLQNVFHRGSYGIYIYGDYSNREKNIVIKQNSFNKQGYTPLYLYYIDKLTLSDNIINAVGNNLYYGTFIEYLKGLSSINNNKINVRGNNANYGLYIYNYSPSANSDSLNIYNNFISISGAQDGIALYTSYLDNTNIYYNNLLNECTDSSGSSTAFYFSGGELNVYNNNFIHLKNGYAYYTDYINYFKSNFNNLYSNGTKYIYWDGVPYSNLNSYKSATALDANSIEADPIYTSSTDLHIAYVGLNAKAKKIAAITKDIDGETRNSTTPDIGADEFTPPSLDAGVTKLFSPGSLYMADTLNVDVIVTNFGLDTIKKVTVQIKINNDTLARKIFTRTFPSGDTIHVRLGQYIFKNDSIYKLTVWSSLPNGATDQKKSNDTLKVLNSSPAMSGVYTIGGTTPNFPTFKAAIKALKLKGMLDSVRFRVRAGTYTEQLSIPFINGAGARNSIIFESQDKDTTKVFLEYGSTYSDTNYVIQLNGAGGVTFRYMHITATSSSNYNHVFDIRGKAHKNTIYKNIIEGPNTNYGSSNNALIYSGQDADDYLLIKDNHIKNGDYGIYLYGNPSSSPYNYEKGLEISGNKILNPFYRGMYIYYADTVNISGNYIYSDKYYSFYGMQLNYLRTNLKINRNIMDLKQGYYGIYMYECGSSFKRGLISNNAFYLKNPSNYSYGIYAYYNYYIDFIHNSINIDNSYTSSTAFQMYYGNNNSIYNNIFVNNGSGYSIYVYSTSSLTSNKNDLFSKGSSLGNWNGTNIPDISTWKSTSAKDTNSLSVDPIFKSAYDLHAKEISINGAAKYFKSVPLDFDNQTRDTLKPDIGADEFSLPQNDAGIHKILVPQKPFPADSQFVKVALKNFGGNSITTVSIRWKFNNVTQTAYSWSGTLLSGDTVHVKLAKRYFDIDSSYDLKAWTSNPNGTADSVNSNDTMQVLDQYPALSGIYTIGGTTPDFSTFTAAINAMKQGGIVDSVRFDVRTGTYNEQIKIPYIHGANKENAIIFQSELKDSSKVKLIGTPTSSNNYTVSLDSVNGVTFRYMRLSTTLPSSYNRVIQMLGACKNINIHNCHIIGKLSTTTGDNEALVYIYNSNSSQPSFNSIKFFKNNFDRGSFGFYVYGYSSFGHGKNLNIYQNNFENQYYMGAYPRYVRDFVFNKNNVYRTNTGYSSGFGIYADYLADGYTITNNKIYNQEYYGIYMNQCNGVTGDTSLIANNFIHVRNNNNSYGLYVYYPNYLNIFNNNIHITSTNSSSYAAYIYYPTYTTVFNNNFITSGAGYAMYCYSGSLIKSNYNNFYTNGTYVANRTSTNYTDLAAWKSATGYDAKSISVNPQYTSNTDLHVAAIDLNAIGRNHKYIITKDIDDQNRDTLKPDIGADEFSPPTLDVGVSQLFSPGSLYKAGTLNVDVIVKNYGIDTVKKVTVQIKINNDTLTRKIFTRTFPSGDTIHVRLGQYTFKADSIYNFTTWSSLPNGEADHKKSNDTLRVLNSRTAMTGVYTIGGTTPNFTTFKAAVNALKLAGMLDSVRFRVRTGTYTEQLTIPAINGSGARNSIIFESQDKDTTKVTLQYNSVYSDTNWVVCLNGADGITFRYMKIKAISTSNYNHVFNIKGKAQYNSINNNIIEGPNTTNASSNNALIYSGADADDYLLIKDNHIRKGDFGIYLYGYPPTSPYTYEKGLEISGNKILNPYYMGIYLEYADTVNISDNYIYSDKYYYSYGMYLYTCYTNLKVNRNILDLRQGYYGIYMYQSGNSYKRKKFKGK